LCRRNFAQYTAPNAVSIDVPTGLEWHGVEGVIEGADRWVTAFPDVLTEILSHEVNVTIIVTKMLGTGTFEGYLFTPDGDVIEGNGQRFTLEYKQEAQVVDGKLVRIRADYDLEDMLRQLGLE
jgi:predicted ester cyclase